MYNYNECCPDNGGTTCPEPEGGSQTIYVSSVQVYPKHISLKVGDWSYAAYAEVCPPYADCTDVRWHSDNSSVASVKDGVVTAHKQGTAVITAKTKDSGVSATCTVTVKKHTESIKISSTSETVYVGKQNLEFLSTIKSKNELIADLVALLQSPAKNVVSALQSGQNTIHGVLQTLGERAE